MKRQVRLTDNILRLIARPVTIFFTCFALTLLISDDVQSAAVKGSALSFALAVFVLVRIFKGRAGPSSVRAVAIFFLIPVFLFGASVRYENALKRSPLKESLKDLVSSTECSFNGIITDISIENDKTILRIQNAYISGGPFYANKNVDGSVKVTCASGIGSDSRVYDAAFEREAGEHSPLLCAKVGDMAAGYGKLRAPAPAANPGGFDEESYYEVRGIDALITASEITITERSVDFFTGIRRLLTDFRIETVNGLKTSLEGEEAAVLAAVLTGERGLLDNETKDALSAGGIAHILAVSGLHISLIAGGLYEILLRLTGRKRASCFTVIFFLLLYGIFTGMPVSAARAVIMSSCMLIGKSFGRTYDTLSALSFAGLIILSFNPLYVRDSSFIMSFCAAGGAAYGHELACGLRIKKKRVMSIFTIGGVYLFMIPALMNTYFYITTYSVVINLIVIPLMSLFVPCGGICILCTLIFGGGAARFAGGLCHYMIRIMIGLSELSQKLPMNKIITGHKNGVITIMYFAVIFLVLILSQTLRKKRFLYILVMCLVIFVKIGPVGTIVHMLDVGQGECIVIQDEGENIMIDAGSTSVSKVYRYRVGPFLKYMGIDRIDRLLLTHSDSDHKNGIEELFGDTDICVKEFICADAAESGCELAELSPTPCKVRKVAAGDIIELKSGSILNVVSPTRITGCADGKASGSVSPTVDQGKKTDKNDLSVVVEFLGKNVTGLFTGDSSSKTEAQYLSRLSTEMTDILKVAHHGSKYSTSQQLLERIKPLIGIISASATNRYGHPSADTLERLESIGCTEYDTPKRGYIRIFCNGGNISVSTIKKTETT